MYAVVGCGECGSFWVLEGRPETTTCPSCGKRHRFGALKKFATADDADTAREARTRLLAARSDHAPDDLDSFADLESRANAGGMDDDEFLERSGLDADRVREAGERATESRGSKSRMDLVREGVSTLDAPTEANIIEYARDHGVPAEFTERALERLRRRGEASEHRGEYRLV